MSLKAENLTLLLLSGMNIYEGGLRPSGGGLQYSVTWHHPAILRHVCPVESAGNM